MLGGVAVLRREDIHHRDRLAGKILERRRECATAWKQLALAFCEAALADQPDLAPKYALVGDRSVLEGRQLRPAEIGFDLAVVHSCQQHLARRSCIEGST